jgi:hypothetical protein
MEMEMRADEQRRYADAIKNVIALVSQYFFGFYFFFISDYGIKQLQASKNQVCCRRDERLFGCLNDQSIARDQYSA